MTPDDIRKSYRQGILLASAGALLHNLGKVSSRFIEKQCKFLKNADYFYQHVVGLMVDFLGRDGSTPREFLQSFGFEEESLGGLGEQGDVTNQVLGVQTKALLQGTRFLLVPPFDDRQYAVGDLVEYLGQREPFYKKPKPTDKTKTLIEYLFGSSSLLTHLMNRCHHGASGGDKQDIYTLQQKSLPLYLATPLGYERPAPDLARYDEIKEEVEKVIQKYLDPENPKDPFPLGEFARELEPRFRQILGDTQRGLNDVTVWDIGHSGMAFLKAGVWSLSGKSGITHDDLSHWRKSHYLRWRLWRVSLNGLDFLTGAVSVADLRVRRRLLREYLDKIRFLVEEAYPVATEVYRDENGSIYVFPDWGESSPEYRSFEKFYSFVLRKENWDSAAGSRDNAEKVEEEVRKAAQAKAHLPLSLPEVFGLCPAIEPSQKNFHNHPECCGSSVKYIGDAVRERIQNPLAAEPVFEAYDRDFKDDLCPYCGVRPVGGGSEKMLRKLPEEERRRCTAEKAGQRKICRVCMGVRGRITKEWWKEENFSTIWVDEVADANGRVALVVGKFGVEKILRELVYPGELKVRYKVFWHYPAPSPGFAPGTRLKVKGEDCTWDGTYLVGPADLGRYKQDRIKIKELDGHNIPWEPQVTIHEIKKDPGTGKLGVSLADDALLTVAKLVGAGNDWAAIIRKKVKALGKDWTISNVREITLDDPSQADGTFRQLLHTLNNGSQRYHVELEPVSVFRVNPAPSASFARFRRVWETTARFWQEVAPLKEQVEDWQKGLAASLAVEVLGKESRRRRLEIVLDPERPGEIAPFHAYELEVAGVSIGIVPAEAGERQVTCVTIENLGYIARQLGAPAKVCTDPCAAAAYVQKFLLEQKKQDKEVQIKVAQGYGSGKEDRGTARISKVRLAAGEYHPIIPVLANPRVFAVLLPAGAAMELVRRIHEKYADEMGKVRWRLPLTLGTVFFPRHLPMRIALDAGWRLLARAEQARPHKAEVVEEVAPSGVSVHDQLGHPQGGNWPASVEIQAKLTDPVPDCRGREIRLTWKVSTVMGDGSTFDIWYPWVKLARLGPGAPADRPLSFRHDRKTWVHVMELKAGDEIEFFPSTWDFVFLENAGERFTIAYDRNGRRLGLKRRPYYLEELEHLTDRWKGVKNHLSSAQRHALWQTLLERYARWALDENGAAQPAPANDKAWQRFCRDTLLNAGWKGIGGAKMLELIGEVPGDRPSPETLTGAAASGALFDLFELYMTILKEGESK